MATPKGKSSFQNAHSSKILNFFVVLCFLSSVVYFLYLVDEASIRERPKHYLNRFSELLFTITHENVKNLSIPKNKDGFSLVSDLYNFIWPSKVIDMISPAELKYDYDNWVYRCKQGNLTIGIYDIKLTKSQIDWLKDKISDRYAFKCSQSNHMLWCSRKENSC